MVLVGGAARRVELTLFVVELLVILVEVIGFSSTVMIIIKVVNCEIMK